MSLEERVTAVDRGLAPHWFKTVTKATFDFNNYAPPQYARDLSRAIELWRQSAAVPLPVMIRYLCEYHAMDLTDDFARITVPTRVLVPSFAPEIFADPKQAYVKPLFLDSWELVRPRNPRFEIRTVANARIFVTDDEPGVVTEAIDAVALRR